MPAPKGNKYAQKYTKKEIERATKIALDYIENPKKYGDIVPTVEGLATVLGIHRPYLYDLAKKYKEVSDTIELLNTHQSKLLITGGLLNKFNACITRLLLSRHGYIEKTETETTTKIKLDREIKEKIKKIYKDGGD